MRIPRPLNRTRGIAGILAAIILFAMLFTAGLGFFLYQNNLSHIYDMASSYSQKQLAARSSQQLSITSHPIQGHTSAGTKLSALLANTGGNSSTVVQFFVRDQSGQLVCLSPAIGSTPSCSTQIVASTNVNVLPSTFSMGVGAGINLTTGYASNNAALTGCSTAALCSIGLVTQIGNVFVGSFPLATPGGVSITTSLNASVMGPNHHVFDTALLSGQTATAGGTVTYSWFGDATCGRLGGAKTSLAPVVVTNGVVPNSAIVKFSTTGYFSFQAAYSGDINNPGATSACETLSVVNGINTCNPITQICQATIAQGLGSLAFDFNSWKWFTSGVCATQGTAAPLSPIGSAPKSSCYFADSLNAVGTATSGTLTTLTESGATWTVNQWAGYSIVITGGSPAGDVGLVRTILSNTATTITVSSAWPAAPSTSTFTIYNSNFIKNGQRAYTISQSGMSNAGTNLAFSINVTNADPQNRTLVIDTNTQVWFTYLCSVSLGANNGCGPGPHGQTGSTYYGLVGMTVPYPSNPSLTSVPSLTLAFGQSTTMFFALQENNGGIVPGIPLCGLNANIPATSQVTPVFMFVHGTVGGLAWGQDFPLAAVLWTNIGASC